MPKDRATDSTLTERTQALREKNLAKLRMDEAEKAKLAEEHRRSMPVCAAFLDAVRAAQAAHGGPAQACIIHAEENGHTVTSRRYQDLCRRGWIRNDDG